MPYPLGTYDILSLIAGSDEVRTGGYKFWPPDLDSAFSICELETMLSTLERPNRPRPVRAKDKFQ